MGVALIANCKTCGLKTTVDYETEICARCEPPTSEHPPITIFKGKYRFLSNFFEYPVQFDGNTYRTVEHAYQAMKSDDPEVQEQIALLATPGKAKRAGQHVKLRDGWEGIKLPLMKLLVMTKFFKFLATGNQLLDTYPRELIEGNHWGDTFWGVCDGVGENHLGKILMEVRDLVYVERKLCIRPNQK